MSDLILRADHVGYVWRSMHEQHRAISDISLEIRSGSPHLICGPSGSGKSTLGLVLSGLLQPSEGAVTLNGSDVSSCRSDIAYVFQFPETLFFADTVEEELLDITGGKIADEQPSVFESLGVAYSDVKDRNPHLLSEGYARLSAIALQMSRNPRVLILDEPTIGLDWKHQARIIAALQERKDPGQMTVIITHDLELLTALGGVTSVLATGGLAWSGPTPDLLSDSERLRQFGLIV